ncbi:MAG: hypothetical protein GY756_12890 [bacterium]|nr:hypothetical protein [bacterium]
MEQLKSNNPFTVLGIEDGVPFRKSKMAYISLIKEYTPEKNPKEFQRIRRAYELSQKSHLNLYPNILRAGIRKMKNRKM